MKKNVSAIDVAKLFLCWANNDGDLITNLKIQKLLYYAQAWHLVYFRKPLFIENVEAWDFGPVIHEAYNHFKKFGSRSIRYKETGEEKSGFNKNQLMFLKDLYDVFIKYAAHELVNMTHNEEPWRKAYKSTDKIISHDSMKSFYSNVLES